MSDEELLTRLERGLAPEGDGWEVALRSGDARLRRAALRSPHLPERWLWDELWAGQPEAWGSALAPLLLWGQRPEWLEQAAMRAHLAMGPRLGWPDVPEEYARDLIRTERGAVRQLFGEMARQRWQLEQRRAPPAPTSARRRREPASPDEPTESLPELAVRTKSLNAKRDRPGGTHVLWYERQRLVVEPPCDEHERRALDLIATVLGVT